MKTTKKIIKKINKEDNQSRPEVAGLMRIVVLDGHTLNPGDLSWEALEKLGDVVVYDRTPRERVVERSLGAELLLTNKTPIREADLDRLPGLKYIGVLATGYDVVDADAAAKRGIAVTNVPSYGTDSVAQFVFALLLELCNRVGLHGESVRGGEWCRSPDFSYWRAPQTELAGKTLGIVGLGRIGERVARLAGAFGMNVLAAGRPGGARKGSAREAGDGAVATGGADATGVAGGAASGQRGGAAEAGGLAPIVRRTSLEELLRESDVVSLHCPLTPETESLINRDTLALMKPTAFLVNTARGRLIAEADLAGALNEGRIAGAALDVLSTEPPGVSNPLLSARNCIVTPHIAWASLEARRRLLDIAADNVARFLAGAPVHIVGRS